MAAIAEHFVVHYSTLSRTLTRYETARECGAAPADIRTCRLLPEIHAPDHMRCFAGLQLQQHALA